MSSGAWRRRVVALGGPVPARILPRVVKALPAHLTLVGSRLGLCCLARGRARGGPAGWPRSRSCLPPHWRCTSCATSSPSGPREAASSPRAATPTCTRSRPGSSSCWRWAPGAFVGALGRAFRSGEAGTCSRRGLLGLWLSATLALVLIYASQEFLEGLFAAGHPAGLQGIFGDGGWLSLPAAAAVGIVLALLVRGGRAAIELAARLRRARPPLGRDSAPILRPKPVFLIAAAPLAACSPSRAPPSWL